MEGVEIELLSLQTALAVQRLHRPRIGIEAHQPCIAAQPKTPGGVGEHAINGVARQAVVMRYDSEADRIRSGGRTDHQGETSAVGTDPNAPPPVDRQRPNGVGRQRSRVVRVMQKFFDHRAVGVDQEEAAAIGADPEVAGAIEREGIDAVID
jgi:hypothetical protein